MSWVLALAAASILAALAEASILAIAAQVATKLVSGSKTVEMNIAAIHIHTTIGTLLLIALGLAIVRLLLQLATSYYPALIAGDVQAGMRRELFHAYTAASWNLQAQDLEGHFQEMMTNQITLASQGALQATALVVSAFTFVILAASAFALNAIAAVAVLGAAIVLFAVLRPATALGQRLAHRLSSAQLQYAGAVGEANSVAQETQVFGVAQAQRGRLEGFIATARGFYIRTQNIGRLVPSVYQSAIYIILVIGLIVINLGNVTGFSSLGAVVLLLVRAGSYGQQLQGAYQFVRQALPYVERIQETTDTYLASEPVTGSRRMEPVRTIAFDDVTYAYRADRRVLNGISFEVTGGETIGVVGPSGAGKSTIVQILLRLRSPDEGRYLVNGIPAHEYAREQWSQRVSYVPQQPRLVHGTVAENVRFFRSLSDEAVERACRLARIHDDIVSWPMGYDTIVGPRADAVSGGQQQRICLARALVGEPQVLVLDEPTSALDPRSESLIQESLLSVQHNLTLFIIAHRMSTLNICDRVMVVLDGTLNAFETLSSLQRSNEYYRHASSLATDNRMPQPSPSATTQGGDRALSRGSGKSRRSAR
jgi:ABC-type multidrug transport system fused ATPase/permease subunit